VTKHDLMALFPAFSPKRAFRDGDDGWELVGKYVNVAWVTNTWDVYIRASTARTNLLAASVPKGIAVKQVDEGEAWWQTKDVELLKAWLEAQRVRLGLRKRRPLPERLRPVAFQGREPVEAVREQRVALEEAVDA
jgi:hypothetical protein